MGTRSLTFVYNGEAKKPFACMYRQMDGYPGGHGKELADFLQPIKMVNGIGDDERPLANGACCLAAQIVAHFKEGVGSIYLYPPDIKDAGQDFEYHVIASAGQGIVVKVYECFAKRKLLYATNDMAALVAWCEER